MSTYEIQKDLESAYSAWRASIVPSPDDLADLSPPLLISVKEDYAASRRRILFVGQETYGWSWTKDLREEYPDYPLDYPYKDIRNMQDFISENQSVEALCWGYREFEFARHQPFSRRSPFWQAFREVQAWPESKVIWNNVSRCDYQGGSILSAPSHTQKQMLEIQRRLFSEELRILKPNACLFFSGPGYDASLSEMFPQLEYVAFGDTPTREFARLIHPSLPAMSFRTYHPNYLSRSKKWDFLEQIKAAVIAEV